VRRVLPRKAPSGPTSVGARQGRTGHPAVVDAGQPGSRSRDTSPRPRPSRGSSPASWRRDDAQPEGSFTPPCGCGHKVVRVYDQSSHHDGTVAIETQASGGAGVGRRHETAERWTEPWCTPRPPPPRGRARRATPISVART
jgi:hypothetical protein